MATIQCDLGILNSRWLVKKLEASGVNMPLQIDVTIIWSDDGSQMSFYSIYQSEIHEIMMNYYCDQVLLFTYFDLEILKEWLWDVFCKEPSKIIVEQIVY